MVYRQQTAEIIETGSPAFTMMTPATFPQVNLSSCRSGTTPSTLLCSAPALEAGFYFASGRTAFVWMQDYRVVPAWDLPDMEMRFVAFGQTS